MRGFSSTSNIRRGESVQNKRKKNEEEKPKTFIAKKSNVSSSFQTHGMKTAKKVDNSSQKSEYDQLAYQMKTKLSRTNSSQLDESNTNQAKKPKTPIISHAIVTSYSSKTDLNNKRVTKKQTTSSSSSSFSNTANNKKEFKAAALKNKTKDLSNNNYDIIPRSRMMSQSNIRSKNEMPQSETYQSKYALKNQKNQEDFNIYKQKIKDEEVKHDGISNVPKKRLNEHIQTTKDHIKNQNINQKEKFKLMNEYKTKDRPISSQKEKNELMNECKQKDSLSNRKEIIYKKRCNTEMQSRPTINQNSNDKIKNGQKFKDKTTGQQEMKYKITNNHEINDKIMEQQEEKAKIIEKLETKDKTSDNQVIKDNALENREIGVKNTDYQGMKDKNTDNHEIKDQTVSNQETNNKIANNNEITNKASENQEIAKNDISNHKIIDETANNQEEKIQSTNNPEIKDETANNQEEKIQSTNNPEIKDETKGDQKIEGEIKNDQKADNKNVEDPKEKITADQENKDKSNNIQVSKNENKIDKQNENNNVEKEVDSFEKDKKSTYTPDFNPVSVNQRPPLTEIPSGAVALDFSIFQQAMNNIQQTALQLQKRLNNKLCCIQKKIADLEISVAELLK